MKILNILYSTLFNKCSRCHRGEVFKYKNPYRLDSMFAMHETCSHCGLKYEKEPSFFYGAMYASYALTAGWFIVWFFIDKFFLHLDTLTFAIGITISIVVLSPLSLRLSRLLWLNFFSGYKREFANKTALNTELKIKENDQYA